VRFCFMLCFFGAKSTNASRHTLDLSSNTESDCLAQQRASMMMVLIVRDK
jgi:hypothetical protein